MAKRSLRLDTTWQTPRGRLDPEELRLLDAWWRAANYLSVGQIYLMDNPLLRRPLAAEDVKPRLLGHWGTTPGLNLIYAHANRAIRRRDLNACYVMGPGHGGPGPNACAWLEGTYTERYPSIRQDEVGMQRLFRQFSFPGGVPSHVAPNTPGSFHEGGELGYSLLHAYGAALDHPDLTVFCVVGDGEAETGALAASWHVNKFINPDRDGTVLPILHLNGYKIANPTILARIPPEDLHQLLRGYGYDPREVTIDLTTNPAEAHQSFASVLDSCLDDIDDIRATDWTRCEGHLPRWPMIVLRSPKGWTGPPMVDGQQVEGTFRAHQVPIPSARTDPAHRAAVEDWMKSYRPEELFNDDGSPIEELIDLPPKGERRMSDNPVANGGLLVVDLELPDFRNYAVEVERPGTTQSEATRVLGSWVRDVIAANPENFLLFGPDEVVSNRLGSVFDVTNRKWMAETVPGDDHLSQDGRVIEVLSEHLCEGLLEGYLLTGRHGLFTCYEAFIHIIDSMFNQHAKWLETASRIPWRRPVASLNYSAHLACVAPRQQRLDASRPRISERRDQQETRCRTRLPPPGRELPSFGRRSLPAESPVRQCHCLGQTAGLGLPQLLTRRSRTVLAVSACGTGHPPRQRTKNPMLCSRVPATCRPWNRLPPRT